MALRFLTKNKNLVKKSSIFLVFHLSANFFQSIESLLIGIDGETKMKPHLFKIREIFEFENFAAQRQLPLTGGSVAFDTATQRSAN